MVDDCVIGAFSEVHAEKLTGISRHQLRRWDRLGFFQPSYAVENRRVAFSRVYSFRDLVSLRVLNELRNVKKISLQQLREVAKHLSHLGNDRWALTTLYVLGKRVVFDDPRTKLRQDARGQRVFDIPLRVVISSTRHALDEMNKRGVDEVGKIVRNRFVSENQPVFSGTRISVASVQRYMAAGYSVAAVLREYPDLTQADLMAAESYQDELAAA